MNGVVSHKQKKKKKKIPTVSQILLLWPDAQIDERKHLKGT